MALTFPIDWQMHARRAAALGLAMSICTAAHAADQIHSDGKWSAWLEFGGAYNNRDASRGEAILFAPLMQGSHDIFFADWRAKLFEDDVQEGNFALGWRQMRAAGWNLGAWGGLDVRSTQYDNTFWQVSGGVEALHPDWDLRANLYLPITAPKQSPGLAEVRLAGDQIFLVGGEEVPLLGIDGEIGARIPIEMLGSALSQHEFRVFAGGFYFDHDEALEEIAGPKARLEWRINDIVAGWSGSRLTIENEYSYDDVRKSRYEVGARLRIPFGSSVGAANLTPVPSLTRQEQRMVERLERDTDIVTAKSESEPVVDVATDVNFDQVAYANAQSGLAQAINRGANTLIILDGGTGQVAGGQTLQNNQTLVGGSGTISVRGRRTGTKAAFTAPGLRPIISEVVNAVLTVANNTHVAHVDLRGNGGATLATNDGIVGESGQRVVIDGVRITGIGDNGIRFLRDNNVTISNVTLRDVDDEGIDFIDNNTVSISNVAVQNANGSAIQFGSGNQVAIRSVAIDNTGGDGLEFLDNNNFSLIGGTISNTGGRGIDANSNNTAVIRDVAVSTAGNAGIRFNNDNTISIENSSVSGTVLDGILVESNNRVTLRDVLVENIGHQALDFHGSNVISISRVTFAGNFPQDLIQFDAAGNQVFNSTGNVNKATAVGGRVCETLPGADFTGTISFVDGTLLRDNVAPCN